MYSSLVTTHVSNTHDIVYTIKKTTVCNSHTMYMLLSQYEFLYSSLVIKLQALRCPGCSCSWMGAASEVIVLRCAYWRHVVIKTEQSVHVVIIARC